ncbi:nuclear transport factor 2 family protein [Shewanella sp. VB17]|uniref:nuclear transport factor 2 family protein n=1 Tax=Shewanella sp. VB17 TaxID=2739432 RepID=UPI001564A3F8|nr:nuclear transport factor 2 family protein [Shewanella sp. VB17]NRD74263.1 nuclear transport factor 2 family protein [Shewanella sp. VB17]
MVHPLWLQNFISIYSELGIDNLSSLHKIYHQNIEFRDPLHQVYGIDDMLCYFDSLYTNLNSCVFNIDNVFANDNQAAIYWTMTFCHPTLNQGGEIIVEGHSYLVEQDNKVIIHRDYFDVGSMLYEHIPLLGLAVKAVKRRAAK